MQLSAHLAFRQLAKCTSSVALIESRLAAYRDVCTHLEKVPINKPHSLPANNLIANRTNIMQEVHTWNLGGWGEITHI